MHRITRLDSMILLLLSASVVLVVFSNSELSPATGDKQTNLLLGLGLSQFGEFVDTENKRSGIYYRREPLYPATIALVDLIAGILIGEQVPRDCAGYGHVNTDECIQRYAPYTGINGVYLFVAAISVFLIVFWSTGSRLLSYSGYFLVASSSMLLRHSVSFYSDIPAAAMMALVAALSISALYRPCILKFGMLGLALAALTLTKVVFAHLWWLIAMICLLAMVFHYKNERRRLLVGVLVMGLSYSVPVGSWMARNALKGGDLSLVQKRAYRVYAVRSSYNQMTDKEYELGFLYYLPHVGEKGLKRMGIDPALYERFSTKNPLGFRRIGQLEYKKRALVQAITAGAVSPDTTIEDMFGFGQHPPNEITRELAVEFRQEMLNDPWRHLKVSVLLAVRGGFPERGVGYYWSPKGDNLVGGMFGFDWIPRNGFKYTSHQITLLNLVTGAAVLLLPFILFFRGRDFSGLLISLPVIYSHAVYALVSHFNPRYSIPEIPLRVAATLVLIGLLFNGLRIVVGHFRDKPRRQLSQTGSVT